MYPGLSDDGPFKIYEPVNFKSLLNIPSTN